MASTRKTAKSSVYRALNTIGDRWSQLIIQAALRGTTRFADFRIQTGAARNTLSLRLRSLVANKVLERLAEREGAARQTYHLTPMGLDLFDSMLMAWSWGIRWDAVAPNGPAALVHTECGKAMLPVMVCGHCEDEISMHHCRGRPGPGAGFEKAAAPRLNRRRNSPSDEVGSRPLLDATDMTADRWTAMVISAQYFGVHRFDQIHAMFPISTNILTDRLNALVAAGVLERRLYEMSPPRYEYWLTRKGKDLYTHALALLIWGDKWLLKGDKPPVIVTHVPCGHDVADAQVVCSACRGRLTLDTVVERLPKARRPAAA